MSHPYKTLPPNAFWKKAIAERSPFGLSEIYVKKFDIDVRDRICTAGSCFAQHIGNRLRKSGFSFLDVEPAPGLLPADCRQEFGYGIYSARYGNIYTARQFLQTFQRAFGEFDPGEAIWEGKGRFYDAFRPTVEPNGFGSRDELLAARQKHFSAVRWMFSKANLMVFTFGLTEAWVSKLDGAVYPLCPGTEAGTFDPNLHEFRNFKSSEVLKDMRDVIEKIRAINPTIKFLLTVSPVPLVATASGRHVLPATMYSKSVLRAVAGELSDDDPLVDYFPSYEIVNSAPMRGMFFEPDARNVTPAGVDFVMSHFFSQHKVPEPEMESVNRSPARLTSDDIVCDEERLEVWSHG